MKFTVFNGSPAAANSSTQVIAEAFLRGAQRAGAETETIFLIEKNIAHCKGCFACWFRTPGKCVMQDDMTALLEKYNTSDVVCFATPVYTWNMTAALKNFADRLVPLKSPKIVQKQGDFDLADSKPKTQKFVAISNCGFPGDNNFEVMKAAFACCAPVLEIYRNCGKLLRSKREDVRLVVAQYLDAVEQAGFELASTGSVTAQTKQRMEMPLMSVPDYVKYLGM
ncbi:MAG: flavodoxin family protein [Eubacteriales bacterium]|nr:flavodoxin family protein [Eubacteriales bacterium]